MWRIEGIEGGRKGGGGRVRRVNNPCPIIVAELATVLGWFLMARRSRGSRRRRRRWRGQRQRCCRPENSRGLIGR